MTDTRVTVNGQQAGPVHQGGYYAFRYNITSLLKPAGQANEIQVDVDDDSFNDSVNRAERRADYWNYGGIFRPVYLEAVPTTYINHVAINADATGSLSVDVSSSDLRKEPSRSMRASIEAQVLDGTRRPVGPSMRSEAITVGGATHLQGMVSDPQLWNAETPNLYQLRVQLKLGNRVVHAVQQRFGFRTIEVRPGHGLFVNGSRVFLKGAARHSFWPDSGRTLSEQVSRNDIELIKEMNGNAFRSSHYPPDQDFLDACDELGIYVLDELGGWHGHYDSEVGRKLVKEMVDHDVNHPSILFWDNGNEGGFNPDLDGEFAKYDPQKRTVIHPWAEFPIGLVDTKHYPTYDQLNEKLAANPVYFATEMLHGLYDGGMAAGLKEYWDAILRSKAGAGGFLWSFVDEDVKRVDEGGVLDSAANQAPDGVVGPYREKEPSFYAVKQLWSPIVVTPAENSSSSFHVTNHYAFTNVETCTFEWEAVAFPLPWDTKAASVVLASRTDRGRALNPGDSADWSNWGPPKVAGREADATRLRIKDASGRVIQTYVWANVTSNQKLAHVSSPDLGGTPTLEESSDALTAIVKDLSVTISTKTGLIERVQRRNQAFSLLNGPRVVAMTPRLPPPRRHQQQPTQPEPPAPTFAPESKLRSIKHSMEEGQLVITALFDGPLKSLTYRFAGDGWLSIDYLYSLTGEQEYFGVAFNYPETKVRGLRFLGEGPGTVYKNRLAGGVLDVWDKPYNNTVVGDPSHLKAGEHFQYPPFKGFYAGLRWMQLDTTEGPITAAVEQRLDAPIYVQVLTPETPAAPGQAFAVFPKGDVSFLHAISPIGSKFVGPRSSGPTGQPAVASGDYSGHISLFFGTDKLQ